MRKTMMQRAGLGIEDRLETQRYGRWLFGVKVSVSVGLTLLVVLVVDFGKMFELLVNVNVWCLLGVGVLYHVSRVLMGYKWNKLLQAVDVRVPFSWIVRTYMVTPLPGMLLPANLGGDLFRVYSMSRYKNNTNAVVASIVVERLIGFLGLLAMALVSGVLLTLWMKESWAPVKQIGWAAAMGVGITVGLLGATQSYFRKWIQPLAIKYGKLRVVEKLWHIYDVLCRYRNHVRTVVIVSVWTLIDQVVRICGAFLTVLAFGIKLHFLEVAVIALLVAMAGRLPISVMNGLGVKEGVYVSLFGLVGASTSGAFLVSMVARVIPVLCALPWSVHYIMRGQQVAVGGGQIINARLPE